MDEVLPRIRNRCDASGAPIDRIKRTLKILGLKKFFDDPLLFSADLVKKPKPAPDLHKYVLATFGFGASDCIVIEDSTFGVLAARNAGIRVFGFVRGSHAGGECYANALRSSGAECVFDDMNNLESLLFQ